VRPFLNVEEASRRCRLEAVWLCGCVAEKFLKPFEKSRQENFSRNDLRIIASSCVAKSIAKTFAKLPELQIKLDYVSYFEEAVPAYTASF